MSGWRDSAACLGYDPEIFFPKPKDVMAIRKAQEVCSGCPVIKTVRQVRRRTPTHRWLLGAGSVGRQAATRKEEHMNRKSQLDFEAEYVRDKPIPVSTDKTIAQIASDAYVQGFVAGRLKPPTEIEIDAALRYLNNNALIRQDITHITVKNALADMCREMRYALTKRTTN